MTAKGYGARLVENHPGLATEVLYAVRNELAERMIDVLTRRMPLAMLDTEATRLAIPRVLELMAKELDWDQQRCAEETLLMEKCLTEATFQP